DEHLVNGAGLSADRLIHLGMRGELRGGQRRDLIGGRRHHTRGGRGGRGILGAHRRADPLQGRRRRQRLWLRSHIRHVISSSITFRPKDLQYWSYRADGGRVPTL